LLAGQAEGRRTANEITVFDSTGLAIQDLAVCTRSVRARPTGCRMCRRSSSSDVLPARQRLEHREGHRSRLRCLPLHPRLLREHRRDGKEPVLLLLLAFLITFALTRLYTRLARVYGWGSGSVAGAFTSTTWSVGILILIVTAIVTVPQWPTGIGRDLIAIFFGVGAALVLVRIRALALPQGRLLVARGTYVNRRGPFMGVMLAGLLMVGISPFGVDDADLLAHHRIRRHRPPRRLAAVTFLKGKLIARPRRDLHSVPGPDRGVPPCEAALRWSRWF
jgi:hypothetical protein